MLIVCCAMFKAPVITHTLDSPAASPYPLTLSYVAFAYWRSHGSQVLLEILMRLCSAEHVRTSRPAIAWPSDASPMGFAVYELSNALAVPAKRERAATAKLLECII
jgi:hypothetical protein